MTDNAVLSDSTHFDRGGQQGWYVDGRELAFLRQTTGGGYRPIVSIADANGSWEIGAYNDKLNFTYVTNTDFNAYKAQTNPGSEYNKYKNCTIQFVTEGNTTIASFSGRAATAVNATSAASLTTARTLTIGNTGKSFNGTANVSWTLDEIGAFSKSGGTISGATTISNTLTVNAKVTATSLTLTSGGSIITSAGSYYAIDRSDLVYTNPSSDLTQNLISARYIESSTSNLARAYVSYKAFTGGTQCVELGSGRKLDGTTYWNRLRLGMNQDKSYYVNVGDAAAAWRSGIGSPPTNHASIYETYGLADSSHYGHVKITDTYTSAVMGTVAASSSALYNVYQIAAAGGNHFYYCGNWAATNTRSQNSWTLPSTGTWIIITGHNSTATLNGGWLIRASGDFNASLVV